MRLRRSEGQCRRGMSGGRTWRPVDGRTDAADAEDADDEEWTPKPGGTLDRRSFRVSFPQHPVERKYFSLDRAYLRSSRSPSVERSTIPPDYRHSTIASGEEHAYNTPYTEYQPWSGSYDNEPYCYMCDCPISVTSQVMDSFRDTPEDDVKTEDPSDYPTWNSDMIVHPQKLRRWKGSSLLSLEQNDDTDDRSINIPDVTEQSQQQNTERRKPQLLSQSWRTESNLRTTSLDRTFKKPTLTVLTNEEPEDGQVFLVDCSKAAVLARSLRYAGYRQVS